MSTVIPSCTFLNHFSFGGKFVWHWRKKTTRKNFPYRTWVFLAKVRVTFVNRFYMAHKDPRLRHLLLTHSAEIRMFINKCDLLDIGECIKKHKNIAHANFSLPFSPKNIENFIGLRFSICHRVQTNAQYITLTTKCTVLCCFFRVGFWIGIPKEYIYSL